MTKTVVGLDIGSSAIRGVQITRNSKGVIQIDKVGEEPLPYGVFEAGSVLKSELLTEAIKALWKKSKFTTNLVRLGVGSDASLARAGEVDWAPDADLYRALPHTQLVAERWVEDRDEYYLDYHPISEYDKAEPAEDDPSEMVTNRKRYVLVAGGKRAAVDALVNATLEAKLKPISVDLNGLALIRAYEPEKFGSEESDNADISIDIGADTVTIVLHRREQPMYMRSVSGTGGNSITKEIAETLGVSWERAELRKFEALYANLEFGDESGAQSVFDLEIPSTLSGTDEENAEMLKVRERVNTVRPIIAEHATGIIETIRETLTHFFEGVWGADLQASSGILLSGGLAITPGFAERLSSEFNCEVFIAEPFLTYMTEKRYQKLPDELQVAQGSYAVAVGLAVGEGSTHG